jgi:hypothetical protein
VTIAQHPGIFESGGTAMNEMYELIAFIAVLMAIVIPIPLVVFIVLSFQRRGQ